RRRAGIERSAELLPDRLRPGKREVRHEISFDQAEDAPSRTAGAYAIRIHRLPGRPGAARAANARSSDTVGALLALRRPRRRDADDIALLQFAHPLTRGEKRS